MCSLQTCVGRITWVMIGDGCGAAATCNGNASSCNRGVHDRRNARQPLLMLTQFPADSGWRVMSLEQAVLPSPSNHFLSITNALLDQPALSIFGRSADDGRVTIPGGDGTDRKERTPSCLPPFCFMPPQVIPVLPPLPLLGRRIQIGEGDIAEIRVFRGDGWNHYEA